jgi:hypothetical protein
VETLQGVVEARLDGASRDAQSDGDFINGQVPVVAERDHHPVIG